MSFESAWAQYVPTLLGFLPGTGRLIYSRTPPILVGGQPAVAYRERYALDVRIERDHSAVGFFLRVRHLNTGPSVANLVRDQAMLPHIEHAAQLLLEKYPQHVTPLIRRWLGLREHYGEV